MNVVMDACSVINLNNGGALETVCSIATIDVQIGPIAGGECSEGCASALAELHQAGLIQYLTDTPLDADAFLEFVEEHGLGDGEAECIMLADLDAETVICCDDMKGRKKAKSILGENRIIGSIGLLKWAVDDGLISVTQAHESYVLMKDAGGFLPDVDAHYFGDSGAN